MEMLIIAARRTIDRPRFQSEWKEAPKNYSQFNSCP